MSDIGSIAKVNAAALENNPEIERYMKSFASGTGSKKMYHKIINFLFQDIIGFDGYAEEVGDKLEEMYIEKYS